MADPTDAALVAAARDGDTTSFALLLERHRPLLVALCRRTLGNRWSAEDAVQEASLQALLGLGHLRHPERFGAWLAGIGLNVCRRMLRQRRFEMWTAETLSGGRSGHEPPDSEPGPEELAEVADVTRRVREAVAALPAGQRSAVIAFYLSGLSYRETATSLAVALPAAKTRLHKARSGLRRELRSLWEEAFAMSDDELIRVRVADVRSGHDEQKPSPFIVLLEEMEGDRRLPIWIGQQEAFALALSLEAIDLPRPLVYQFVRNALEATGARLVEVRVERLVEGTYYAVAVFQGAAGTAEVDARPSDALNLALLGDAPVWVRRQAWEAGRRINQEALGRLDELFPSRGRGILPPDTPPQQKACR